MSVRPLHVLLLHALVRSLVQVLQDLLGPLSQALLWRFRPPLLALELLVQLLLHFLLGYLVLRLGALLVLLHETALKLFRLFLSRVVVLDALQAARVYLKVFERLQQLLQRHFAVLSVEKVVLELKPLYLFLPFLRPLLLQIVKHKISLKTLSFVDSRLKLGQSELVISEIHKQVFV